MRSTSLSQVLHLYPSYSCWPTGSTTDIQTEQGKDHALGVSYNHVVNYTKADEIINPHSLEGIETIMAI